MGNIIIQYDGELDPAFISHIESIIKCECCKNNFSDQDHRHSKMCDLDQDDHVVMLEG